MCVCVCVSVPVNQTGLEAQLEGPQAAQRVLVHDMTHNARSTVTLAGHAF